MYFCCVDAVFSFEKFTWSSESEIFDVVLCFQGNLYINNNVNVSQARHTYVVLCLVNSHLFLAFIISCRHNSNSANIFIFSISSSYLIYFSWHMICLFITYTFLNIWDHLCSFTPPELPLFLLSQILLRFLLLINYALILCHL